MGLGDAALWFIPTRTRCNSTRTQPGASPLPFILRPPSPLAQPRTFGFAPRSYPAHVPPRKGRVKLGGFILGGTMTPRHVKKQAARALPLGSATC